MLAFSSSEESITLWAHSNFTFVIVAAVRRLPTAKGSDVFDFGCFMPSSVPITGLLNLLFEMYFSTLFIRSDQLSTQ